MNSKAGINRVAAFLRVAPDSMVCHLRRSGSDPRLYMLNILWSAWVFLTPLFTVVGPPYWWSLIVGYPIFLLLFVAVHVRPYRESAFYVSALALLAIGSMPFNATAWTYGVFACVYVPYYGSLTASAMKILVIELLLALEAWWLGWPWFVPLILVGVCTSSGFGALMSRISAIQNATQRLSQDEVRRLAATAERERIGRDLHDLLGHTLSLITLKLELSRKLFDRDHAAARRELEEAEQVARKALAEVRSAVTGIRTTDMAAELASARLLLESSGVTLVGDRPRQGLPVAVEPTLAMIVREAVTNIARHAQARRVTIDIALNGGEVLLSIADDGRGGVRESGNGLNGMRERAQSLGGTLQVESSRGGGTRLEIRVPALNAMPPEPARVAPAAAVAVDPGLDAGKLAGGRV